jgi:hypothetical protein
MLDSDIVGILIAKLGSEPWQVLPSTNALMELAKHGQCSEHQL